MTTPKERAHLLDLLNRTVDWPLVAVVDAIAELIESRDQAQAKEFRRLAVEAETKRSYFRHDAPQRARYAERRDSFTEAAQMLEERLNG